MTIGGALSELQSLMDGDMLPDYYKPVIKKVIETIQMEFEEMELKQKWIPVSERLPEDGQHVLFCDIDGDIMIGYHVKGRPDTHFSQDGSWDNIKNVRAWMPLPPSYQGESENKG